ncbi:PrsW family intramembrane metalloprotease [Microlunatus elymi]|uniref:PrsW family intramembrane metalloprotease n=1 Tax=Microlunatus elymi TaxID=2596828 RepID=A0A516Q062_9ACTN|nr:PrsW family glutamic-type intramembrane protease [Microlunatus elymi]QDP96808.1 PrsW family intramembrane metalloprotease [Microlunatus elymi]
MATEAVAPQRRGWWWKTLIGGAALWLITAAVTLATENSNLVPTVILLGSFLVPFSVVLFAAERVEGNLDTLWLMMAFFVGGVFGVLGASILEVNLKPSWHLYLAVGAIEEFVKGLVFIVVGWRVAPKVGRQGALLGATVGAGFAAFESAGYAFNAGLTRRGVDVVSMLETEAVRAVLTPVGHVLWTAILGAAIFAAAGARGKYRFTWTIPLAFVMVAILHSLWDSMGFISAVIAIAVAGGVRTELAYGQLLQPTVTKIKHLSTIFYVIGLAIISVLGILALRVWGRHRTPKQHAGAPAAGPNTGSAARRSAAGS